MPPGRRRSPSSPPAPSPGPGPAAAFARHQPKGGSGTEGGPAGARRREGLGRREGPASEQRQWLLQRPQGRRRATEARQAAGSRIPRRPHGPSLPSAAQPDASDRLQPPEEASPRRWRAQAPPSRAPGRRLAADAATPPPLPGPHRARPRRPRLLRRLDLTSLPPAAGSAPVPAAGCFPGVGFVPLCPERHWCRTVRAQPSSPYRRLVSGSPGAPGRESSGVKGALWAACAWISLIRHLSGR
nr:uncharacterized protein LOC111770565 [Equus caballus]